MRFLCDSVGAGQWEYGTARCGMTIKGQSVIAGHTKLCSKKWCTGSCSNIDSKNVLLHIWEFMYCVKTIEFFPMHQAPKICIFTILACINSAIIISVYSYNYWMYACKGTMTTFYAGFRNYPFLVKLYSCLTKDSWQRQMISFSPLSIMLL